MSVTAPKFTGDSTLVVPHSTKTITSHETDTYLISLLANDSNSKVASTSISDTDGHIIEIPLAYTSTKTIDRQNRSNIVSFYLTSDSVGNPFVATSTYTNQKEKVETSLHTSGIAGMAYSSSSSISITTSDLLPIISTFTPGNTQVSIESSYEGKGVTLLEPSIWVCLCLLILFDHFI